MAEAARDFIALSFTPGGHLEVFCKAAERAGFDLRAMLTNDPAEAAAVLTQAAHEALKGNQLTQMQVKYAAFSLGQLGYSQALPFLWLLAGVEEYGIQSAAIASIAAIAIAPPETESQAERRAIIDKVYNSNPKVSAGADAMVRQLAELAAKNRK